MLMHFHAYIPSFSYIIIYFVLVLFRLYLCLSLSLSFYVCLLLWHPMRSKAYSSSDPTPSSVQFCDENAWKDFLENFCRRGIHLECHVILPDFSDTDLPTVIHSRGWESLCDIWVTCLSMIIQEFYSNMHGIDTSVPYFFFHARGTHIVVTLEIVFEVLHASRVVHPDYPGYERLRTVSKDELSPRFCETPSSWGDR